MNMKQYLYKTGAILASIISISTPFLLIPKTRYQEINTLSNDYIHKEDYDDYGTHQEDFWYDYDYVDRDIIPWDMFGDWNIPERIASDYFGSDHWDGWGDWKGNPIQWNNELIEASYDENDIDGHYIYILPNTNWHDTYSNLYSLGPNGSTSIWNDETNRFEFTNNYNVIPEDTQLTSRTPMRGIVPFWEWTNDFNKHILEETNDGTTPSDNLYFEEEYATYVANYTSKIQESFPSIYKYLENPLLLDDVFLSDDSVNWMLPEDYHITYNDSLTNAFVGLDPDWNLYSFFTYIIDYITWNWNTNVYPNKDPDLRYYDQLEPKISPFDGNFDFISYGDPVIYTDGISGRWQLSVMLNDGTGYQEDDARSLNLAEAGLDDINFRSIKWDYNAGIRTTSLYLDKELAPTYNWKENGSTINAGESYENFYMFNPGQQMSINHEPTIVDFSNLNSSFNSLVNEINSNDKKILYQETTFQEFKLMFENWLLTSEDGINKEFIDFYAANENPLTYYSNLSKDGTAFIGHNRLQSGIFPIEDLRLNDLNIEYLDQDGNVISNDTLLGDITNISINISYKESTVNNSLFSTKSGATNSSLNYDTSNLDSMYPDSVITEENSDSGISGAMIGIIIAVSVLVVAGIAIGIIVSLKKRK